MTPDGEQLITHSPGTLRIWDLSKGEALSSIGLSADRRSALALSPDGRWLAVAQQQNESDRSVLAVWDLLKGREHTAWSGPVSAIHALAISSDGRMLASGDDHGLRMWEVATWQGASFLQGTPG